MTLHDYEFEAMKTASNRCRCLSNVALGLSGESGDFATIVKKYLHSGKNFSFQDALTELGDILWYLTLGCEELGYTLEDAAKMSLSKLHRMYPDIYGETAEEVNTDV